MGNYEKLKVWFNLLVITFALVFGNDKNKELAIDAWNDRFGGLGKLSKKEI
jgi:hypothetical protein